MSTINISGLPKGKVLAAPYNNQKVQGMGVFQAVEGQMTEQEADELLKQTTYFDYLHGKVMKINLSKDDEFDGRLYDRDLGEGAAERVVNSIRN